MPLLLGMQQRALSLRSAAGNGRAARSTFLCSASASSATTSKRALEVVVVGGGVGGLCAGRALADAGIPVRVYERRGPQDAMKGAGGLMLQANAAAIMNMLSGSPTASAAAGTLTDAVEGLGGPIRSGGFTSTDISDRLYHADVSSTGEFAPYNSLPERNCPGTSFPCLSDRLSHRLL